VSIRWSLRVTTPPGQLCTSRWCLGCSSESGRGTQSANTKGMFPHDYYYLQMFFFKNLSCGSRKSKMCFCLLRRFANRRRTPVWLPRTGCCIQRCKPEDSMQCYWAAHGGFVRRALTVKQHLKTGLACMRHSSRLSPVLDLCPVSVCPSDESRGGYNAPDCRE